MKPLYIFFFTFLFSYGTKAQTIFQRLIMGEGVDYAISAIEVNAGGYLLAGSKSDAIFIVRLNSQFDTVWTKSYASYNMSAGGYVREVEDGGFIIGAQGITEAGVNEMSILLIRIDSNGEEQWTKSFSTSNSIYITGMAVTTNGYLISARENISQNVDDSVLIKTDFQGNLLWSTIFGINDDDHVESIVVSEDGGCVAVGTIYISESDTRAILFTKWDSDGNLQWSGIYDNGSDSYGFHVIEAGDGNGYVVCGITSGGEALSYDGFLLRINEDYSVQWSKTYGGSGIDNTLAVAVCEEGFAAIGQTFSCGFQSDITLQRVDNNGDLVWSKAYGGTGFEFANGLICLPDGFFIAGGREDVGNDQEVYMIRTNMEGDSGCNSPACEAEAGNAGFEVAEIELNVIGNVTVSQPDITTSGGASTSTLCEIVLVPEEEDFQLGIYPNPFNLSFTLPGTIRDGKIVLTDFSGKVIMEEAAKEGYTLIDVSRFSAGVYFVSYADGRRVMNVKAIKE